MLEKRRHLFRYSYSDRDNTDLSCLAVEHVAHSYKECNAGVIMKEHGNLIEGILILAGLIVSAGFLFGIGFGLGFGLWQ